MTYTFDPTHAERSRTTSITIDAKAYDPLASYRIGTFSFHTDGSPPERASRPLRRTRCSTLEPRTLEVKVIDLAGLVPA